MSSRLAGGSTLAAAIGCFVVAFLLVLGGVFFYGFTATAADGRYGRVPIPGQAVITLPAGRVDVSFTEDLVNRVIDVPRFTSSIVSVRTGAALHLTDVDRDATAVNGVSHVQIGVVTVRTAGPYRVSIGGNDVGLGQQLRFGTARQHGWQAVTAIVIAGVLVLTGLTLILLYTRARRRLRATEPSWPDQLV